MSVSKTTTKILHLEPSKIENFFEKLLSKGLEFQVMDSKDLGDEWKEVYNFEAKQLIDVQTKISTIEEVLMKNVKYEGALSQFADNRIEASFQEIKDFGSEVEKILEIANQVIFYNKLNDDLARIKKFQSKTKEKEIFFGENLGLSINDFYLYVDQIIEEAKSRDLSFDEYSISRPDIIFDKIENLEALIFHPEDEEVVTDFLNSKGLLEKVQKSGEKILSITKQIQETRNQIREVVDENGFLNKAYFLEFAKAHGFLEIKLKGLKASSKAFSLEQKAHTYFSFVTIPNSQTSDFEKILSEENIQNEAVDWQDEIVDWSNPGALNSFQGIAQSIGTIDEKESDPTIAVSIFFMIFFAFCLADAIYGLIVTAFTGYFLFVRGVKNSFKPMFNIFFFSGVATTLFGVLTNSWAGDLFNSDLAKRFTGTEIAEGTSTPINSFLANFQLIDILNADSNAAINLAIGDFSPIMFMMILAILIGFLNQLVGYFFRLNTNLRKGNLKIVLGQASWLFFLATVIVSIFASISTEGITTPVQALLVISLFLLFIFNQATSIGGKFLGFLLGPRGLYGLVQLSANLISYVRIVAIALTGSVIASIINLMAGLIYEGAGPIFGLILAVLLLIGGHLFNIVISFFGAYINPLRLTYVEFMPTFFSGEGKQIEKENPDFAYLKLTTEKTS